MSRNEWKLTFERRLFKARKSSRFSRPRYDGSFVRRARPGSRWAHEHTSAALLQRIVDDYGLLGGVFGRYGLTSDDVHHVQELIFGAVGEAPDGWEWRGRGGPSKAFLYEIVANHRNGIDVDKFDYFARDCYHLNIPISFDCERLIMHARAIRDRDGVSTIAYAEKEVWNVYELFRTRFNLHKRAYQHRVVHAVERMLCDALLLAEPFLRLPGTGGARVPLSRAMEDLTAYTGLTDSVFDVIAYAAADDDRSEPGAGKAGAPRPSRETVNRASSPIGWSPPPRSCGGPRAGSSTRTSARSSSRRRPRPTLPRGPRRTSCATSSRSRLRPSESVSKHRRTSTNSRSTTA